MIAKESAKPKADDDDSSGGAKPGDPGTSPPTENKKVTNAGKIILDATCVPADIHYPTDIWLLNEAREALEEIIDTLHEPHVGTCVKPRTYRDCARKDYLNVEKKKKLTAKKIHKAIGQQLRYIRRDLKIIEQMIERSSLTILDKRQYRNLLVCHEIYRQQLEMYQKKIHQIDDRIVSLHMPFIRPIVWGKTGAAVEFGAKLAISIVNGFSFMEHLSFKAFNEGITLIESLENFHRRFRFYPEVVFADKIYRNRENL